VQGPHFDATTSVHWASIRPTPLRGRRDGRHSDDDDPQTSLEENQPRGFIASPSPVNQRMRWWSEVCVCVREKESHNTCM
jgi:hypothetical protein